MRDAHKPITTLRHILTDVKDKETLDEKHDVIFKMICFFLPGYLYWGDWKKLKHTTNRAVASLEETRQDKSHCQTSTTNGKDTTLTRIRQHAFHTTIITNKDLP